MTGRGEGQDWVCGVRCAVCGSGPNTAHRTPNAGFSLALALILTLSAPVAAHNAVALMRRGVQAEKMARYSGVKLIWASRPGAAHHPGDYERSARIWHDGPGRTRLEFLPSDGGPARVVIENDAQHWFYSPQHHVWRPVSWRPPESRLELLLKNYRVLPGSVERVAGRPALLVLVEPRFPGNPRKHAWLDLATGITLRAELYDSAGRLVSRSEFLRFHPEHALPASLFSLPDAEQLRRAGDRLERTRPEHAAGQGRQQFGALELANSHYPFEPVLPRYLPRGYVLDRVTHGGAGPSEAVWALFTDGLNTLSLVQWCGPREPPDGGRERFWGPGDRLRWRIGPVNVMLAGDLAADELKRIAASLHPSRPSAGSLVTRK